MFWGGYMPEGEEDKAPWAAHETSIDVSECVTTNLEVHVFKSEVRRSRFLTETKMRLSGIGDPISDIVRVVGIVWRVKFKWQRIIWIHILDKWQEKNEFII